ncbi:hypothetical protein M9458_026715, partial [Cirrhinus mrigala]
MQLISSVSSFRTVLPVRPTPMTANGVKTRNASLLLATALCLQLSLPATLEVPCTSTLPLQCFLSTSSLFGDPACAKTA